MPTKSGRSSKANPLSEANRYKYNSVSAYIEKITEWRLWGSCCINGEVFIRFHNHLVPYAEFMKLQPNPNVSDFKVDITNIDSTTTALQ